MPETMTFRFEGSLADFHRMNFYESARFQYAAARLMVKLAQFRQNGRFFKKITNKSNFDILLESQTDGSFNINVEDPGQDDDDDLFLNISLSDLLSYLFERIVGKVNVEELADPRLVELMAAAMRNRALVGRLPQELQDLVKRRDAELFREQRLAVSHDTISRIGFEDSQKLISMAAPLVKEMATALRRSADTLEVISSNQEETGSVFFLNKAMAQEIETAIVDDHVTPILGDIIQFNKDNGWGKIRIEEGTKTVSFSIPYDHLLEMKQQLIDNMKLDLVYLQTYFVRDPAGDVIRLIAWHLANSRRITTIPTTSPSPWSQPSAANS